MKTASSPARRRSTIPRSSGDGVEPASMAAELTSRETGRPLGGTTGARERVPIDRADLHLAAGAGVARVDHRVAAEIDGDVVDRAVEEEEVAGHELVARHVWEHRVLHRR